MSPEIFTQEGIIYYLEGNVFHSSDSVREIIKTPNTLHNIAMSRVVGLDKPHPLLIREDISGTVNGGAVKEVKLDLTKKLEIIIKNP